jgi:hypothetical protein
MRSDIPAALKDNWKEQSETFLDIVRNHEPTVSSLLLCSNGYRAELVQLWWKKGKITLPQLREFLVHAWEGNDRPYNCLGVRGWVRLYKAAGFIHTKAEGDNQGEVDDGVTKPTQPLVVYRGTTPAYWRRMSWTTDQQQALWFAEWIKEVWKRPDSFVISTTVPPKHILAMLNGRGESEVVVNPNGLRSYDVV